MAAKLSPADVGNLYPEVVLCWYNGPNVFTTHRPNGVQLLVYCCTDVSAEAHSFLAVPIDPTTLARLTNKEMDLHAAFMLPGLLLIDKDRDGQVVGIKEISYLDVSGSLLPVRERPI